MDVHVIQVVETWLFIHYIDTNFTFCRKSDQSLVVDVQPERVTPSHQHIDSQVELEPLKEERIGYVLLHNAVLVVGDFWLC